MEDRATIHDLEDVPGREDCDEMDGGDESSGQVVAMASGEQPLLFIETTGFNIYADAITDIRTKVIDIPSTSVRFGSLVMTSKDIPEKG